MAGCRWILTLGAAFILSGCASGFEKFYTPSPNAAALVESPLVMPVSGPPKLYLHSSDINADAKHLAEDGYLFIGSSSFYGPANKSNQRQAIKQGERVGAAIVLFKSEYMDTLSGVVPYTIANPPVVSTINASGTVTSYGSSGYATGNYSSTGTVVTPGGTSTYAIPYSLSRNTFFASYWIRQDLSKMRLGVRYASLTAEVSKKLERNTGVIAQIVMRGTPAFRANILEGDILLRIDGVDIVDPPGFGAQLAQLAGQIVTIDLIRGDQPRSITVTLKP